jgi:hypothetical protein
MTSTNKKSSYAGFTRGNASGYLTRESTQNYGDLDAETYKNRYSPQRDGSSDGNLHLKPVRGNHTMLGSTGFTREGSAGKDYSYSSHGGRKLKRKNRLNASLS